MKKILVNEKLFNSYKEETDKMFIMCPHCENRYKDDDDISENAFDEQRMILTCKVCGELFKLYIETPPRYTTSKIIKEDTRLKNYRDITIMQGDKEVYKIKL